MRFGNKFHAKKVKDDGITFDSMKEHDRFVELRALEKQGKISNLLVHVPFVLIPKSKYGREIKYVCDFQYFNGEEAIVEDVKSKATITPVYRLKKRLMQEIYNVTIHEYM